MVWYGDSPETSNNKKLLEIHKIDPLQSSHHKPAIIHYCCNLSSKLKSILSPQNDDVYVQFFVWFPLTQD